MSHIDRTRDPLPSQSASLAEVAEFWDTHDTTDYEDAFVTADVEFGIRGRRHEVEIKDDVYEAASRHSEDLHISLTQLIDGVLRKNLIPPGRRKR